MISLEKSCIILPLKAKPPPTVIAAKIRFFFTLKFNKPAKTGTKNAPEKTVNANNNA